MAAGTTKRGQEWVVENVGEVWGGAELDCFGEDGGDGVCVYENWIIIEWIINWSV